MDGEDEATQRAWAMAGYINQCAIASQNQREARRQVPEYPPPCDGWMGGEEGVEL